MIAPVSPIELSLLILGANRVTLEYYYNTTSATPDGGKYSPLGHRARGKMPPVSSDVWYRMFVY